MNTQRITGIQWLPLILLLGGLILIWFDIDTKGIAMNAGFVWLGVAGVIHGLRQKYYQRLNLDTVRIVLPVLVVVLAADNLLMGTTNYASLAVTVVFQYLLDRRSITASAGNG